MGCPPETQKLRLLAERTATLDLLVLFGSRARSDEHAGSDFDLAYLARTDFDALAFLGQAVRALGTERVDLVDLERADGLIRYRVARDGQVIFERGAGTFRAFQLRAAEFWCDTERVLRIAYRSAIERMSA